jgi:GTPase SAR1 family protein
VLILQPGEKRFRSITRSYYDEVAGAVLVYDKTRYLPNISKGSFLVG